MDVGRQQTAGGLIWKKKERKGWDGREQKQGDDTHLSVT